MRPRRGSAGKGGGRPADTTLDSASTRCPSAARPRHGQRWHRPRSAPALRRLRSPGPSTSPKRRAGCVRPKRRFPAARAGTPAARPSSDRIGLPAQANLGGRAPMDLRRARDAPTTSTSREERGGGTSARRSPTPAPEPRKAVSPANPASHPSIRCGLSPGNRAGPERRRARPGPRASAMRSHAMHRHLRRPLMLRNCHESFVCATYVAISWFVIALSRSRPRLERT
jgi:hypothetical protein